MSSDFTLIGRAATAAATASLIAGRAPRITRAEAATEPLPTNPPRSGAADDLTDTADAVTLH